MDLRPDDLARPGTERQDLATAQVGKHHQEHRLGSRDLTHASFFSGVGGLDLGLERAGWRTVSLSEIDPYANAVLAERWAGVPNLGDITLLSRGEQDAVTPKDIDWGSLANAAADKGRDYARFVRDPAGGEWIRGRGTAGVEHRPNWPTATLWSGGFPCQDLSVAGKRRGMGTHDDRSDTRSGLAYAFLDLVEQHRPPAILLENVPGLLSSNGGKDLGALLGRLGELGYWWAYRILDAQYFGVPQRRRRVFICALHAGAGFGADSPAAVLSVGSRCGGHSAAGDQARTAASDGLAAGFARSLSTSQWRIDADTESFIVRPPPDPGGMREADGLAGRLDDSQVAYRKAARVSGPGTPETWVDDGLANTLNSFDVGDIRTTHLVSGERGRGDQRRRTLTEDVGLPLGLDSHRYRCCGNGVVSNVSEWIGVRLAREVSAA